MANFRAERLFIRVAGSLDFDPNGGIDAEVFAEIMVMDYGTYERSSLQEFSFAPFDQPRWLAAADGLAAVRGLISEMQQDAESADDSRGDLIKSQIEVLRVVEDHLDSIDLKGYRFHFLIRDLE